MVQCEICQTPVSCASRIKSLNFIILSPRLHKLSPLICDTHADTMPRDGSNPVCVPALFPQSQLAINTAAHLDGRRRTLDHVQRCNCQAHRARTCTMNNCTHRDCGSSNLLSRPQEIEQWRPAGHRSHSRGAQRDKHRCRKRCDPQTRQARPAN